MARTAAIAPRATTECTPTRLIHTGPSDQDAYVNSVLAMLQSQYSL